MRTESPFENRRQDKVVYLVPKLFATAKGARAARPRVEKPASRERAVRAPIAPRHFAGFVCQKPGFGNFAIASENSVNFVRNN
jgi:hypothetical protein